MEMEQELKALMLEYGKKYKACLASQAHCLTDMLWIRTQRRNNTLAGKRKKQGYETISLIILRGKEPAIPVALLIEGLEGWNFEDRALSVFKNEIREGIKMLYSVVQA